MAEVRVTWHLVAKVGNERVSFRLTLAAMAETISATNALRFRLTRYLTGSCGRENVELRSR